MISMDPKPKLSADNWMDVKGMNAICGNLIN